MIKLAFKHAASRWGRSVLLCASVFVIAALPLVSRGVVSSFEQELRERAETVPILVGSAGSRFDLVLSALHWRVSKVTPITLHVAEEIFAEPEAVAIPVHVRFEARGEPVAAVPLEYFEFRGLTLREGRSIAGLGEAVLGSMAANRLGLSPGDDLPTDQSRSYDITAPPAIILRVVGVLAETGTPDDRAVFVELETAWLLEGIAHGHQDPTEITDPNQLVGRSDERIALSGAVIEHQRIDASNAAQFHLHADRDDLPITAVMVFPGSDKSTAIVRTRVNADRTLQAISPSEVSEELIGSVLRVGRLVDAISVVVGLAMLGLLTLVGMLELRARADETRVLRDVGASRAQVVNLFLFEFGGLATIGFVLALIAARSATGIANDILVFFT
ncbi:MAG: ABC transporter permease [Phycisphaerales bacterium]